MVRGERPSGPVPPASCPACVSGAVGASPTNSSSVACAFGAVTNGAASVLKPVGAGVTHQSHLVLVGNAVQSAPRVKPVLPISSTAKSAMDVAEDQSHQGSKKIASSISGSLKGESVYNLVVKNVP